MRKTYISINNLSFPCRIGLISDSHLNANEELNPRVNQVFSESKVKLILHLGDIMDQRVIDDLQIIARTLCVRGNRDLKSWPGIPAAILLEINGLRIGLTHGHGTMLQYIWDKMHYVFVGFRFERYRRLLDSIFPDVQIKCFGHTHVAFNRTINGIIYINPGAACDVSMHDPHPSVGILYLDGINKYRSEIVCL